jgi:hypothetical protein
MNYEGVNGRVGEALSLCPVRDGRYRRRQVCLCLSVNSQPGRTRDFGISEEGRGLESIKVGGLGGEEMGQETTQRWFRIIV